MPRYLGVTGIIVVLAAISLVVPALFAFAAKSSTTHGVANTSLAAAARNAMLKDIDFPIGYKHAHLRGLTVIGRLHG